jgi:hypothetical protein
MKTKPAKIVPCTLVALVLFLIGIIIIVSFSMNCTVVTRVIDGDTFELKNGAIVRLIGIDAPEKGQQYYAEAKQRLSELVLNKTVSLEADKTYADDYDRLLKYVYVNNKMINLVLVEEGFAVAKAFPPDVKYKTEFDKAELQAKSLKLGLWSEANATACTQLGCPANTLFAGSKLSNKYHDCTSRNARMIAPTNIVCFANEAEATAKNYTKTD